VLFVIAVAFVSYSDIKAEFDREAEVRSYLDKLSDDELLKRYEELQKSGADEQRAPSAWAQVGMAAGIAFGVPLVVLILGSSLVWAFSGFATKRP